MPRKKSTPPRKGNTIRRVSQSRIDRYLNFAKSFLSDERKMETRLKSYSKVISTLSASSDPMSKTKVSVLQYKSSTLSKDLDRVKSKRLITEVKIKAAIDRNNSIDSTKK